MDNFPVLKLYFRFQQYALKKVIWPYSPEINSIYRWRASVLVAILTSTLAFGLISYFLTLGFLIEKKLFGLLFIDTFAIVLCLVILFGNRIRFEIRALITLGSFFLIGISVVSSASFLSGGTAWLFAFPVLTALILGRKAVLFSLLLNSVFFIISAFLVYKGYGGNLLPISLTNAKLTSIIVNFLMLNAITSLAVSYVVKGVFEIYKTKEELAESLKKEQSELIEKKESLESEIVERKIAEKEIWEINQFRNSIIENANIWISVFDETGKVIVWNRACESISGYPREKIVGNRSVWNLIFPQEEFRKKMLDRSLSVINNNETIENYECIITRSDGSNRIISWYLRTLFDDNDKKLGAIAIARDITKRAKAEEEMRDAKKIAGEHTELVLVGQVAGKLAHDFNNILGIIMGNAELAMVICEEPKILRTLELILDQTLRGKNLTKNLVAFAKSQEPRQIFFQISEKIDLVVSLLKNDLEDISLITDIQEDMPDLMADPGMIEHALVNLIQNSIHATSKTRNPVIRISSYLKDDKIFLEIEDNGCGIPEDHIDDIYIPSFTLKGSHDITGSYNRKIKGTGYGMSNVKKYVTQHKGKITVKSIFGEYTKFTICLPLIEKDLTGQEKKELEESVINSGKKILLVEDEPTISNVLMKILSNDPFNHKVDVVTNGKEAIELFGRNFYDIASLDYLLSGDLTGMDVYNHIREKNKSIPVLFLSGNIEFLESIRDLKKKDPFLDHLSKPCRNKEYVDTVNRLINGSM